MERDKEMWARAEQLAARPYTAKLFKDNEAEGEAKYLAQTVEMPGCMAQGATVDDALRNLDDAKIDFIYQLLADELPVPEPLLPRTNTAGATVQLFKSFWFEFSGFQAEEPVETEEAESSFKWSQSRMKA